MTVPALGVTLPQFTDDPERMLSAARRAEALGLDSVWVFDHLWPLSGGTHRPVIEAWTALSWLAETTQRVRVGTLVSRSTLRHPAVLAKMAATVATIAPGRVIVGIGSGDDRSRAENEAFGLPYYSDSDRVEQLADVVATLVETTSHRVVVHRSRFASLDGLHSSPLPEPRPPVWVAGHSPAVIKLAGRVADGWNGWGGTPQRFARAVASLDDAAGERRVEATWGGLAILGGSDEDAWSKVGVRDPRDYVVGGPDALARHLSAMSAAGASHLIVTFPDAARPDVYERLAQDVRARLDGRSAPSS